MGGAVEAALLEHPDIVEASAKAYLNALNKLCSGQEKLNPQI